MAKRKHSKAGWRLDGIRVYHVKGIRKSNKKTYRTKLAALRHLRKRRK